MSFDGYLTYGIMKDFAERSRESSGFQKTLADTIVQSQTSRSTLTASSRQAALQPAQASISAPVVPGQFTQGAAATITSRVSEKTADGLNATYQRSFSDGSTSVQQKTRTQSGTEMMFIRRSLPDADGMQTIRVRRVMIDADGQRHVEIKTYKAPENTVVEGDGKLSEGLLLRALRFIRHEKPDGTVERLPWPVDPSPNQIDEDQGTPDAVEPVHQPQGSEDR